MLPRAPIRPPFTTQRPMMRALRTEELPRPHARFINPLPVIESGKRAPKAQKKNAPIAD